MTTTVSPVDEHSTEDGKSPQSTKTSHTDATQETTDRANENEHNPSNLNK
jgi:hypothetical protein